MGGGVAHDDALVCVCDALVRACDDLLCVTNWCVSTVRIWCVRARARVIVCIVVYGQAVPGDPDEKSGLGLCGCVDEVVWMRLCG